MSVCSATYAPNLSGSKNTNCSPRSRKPSTNSSPVWIIILLWNTPVKNACLASSFCFQLKITHRPVWYRRKVNTSVWLHRWPFPSAPSGSTWNCCNFIQLHLAHRCITAATTDILGVYHKSADYEPKRGYKRKHYRPNTMNQPPRRFLTSQCFKEGKRYSKRALRSSGKQATRRPVTWRIVKTSP